MKEESKLDFLNLDLNSSLFYLETWANHLNFFDSQYHFVFYNTIYLTG